MSGKDWKKQRRFRQAFARQLQKMLHKPLLMPPYNGPLHSIAILAQEKYGDAILLTPLLRQLSIHFPKTEVHLITFSQATHDFFRNDRNIDALHFAKGNTIAYYRRILSRRFDLLFNTKDHPSTSFLLQSLIIRARRKAGIDCPYHRGIYDYLVDLDFHTQVALKNCGLLSILGKPAEPQHCRPYLPEEPVSAPIEVFLSDLPNKICIGMNISAGGPTRYWKTEYWRQVAEAFPAEKFLVLSLPGDIETKKNLELWCSNIIPSPLTRNLFEVGLIVSKLKLLITPDTAMVHVASCTNTPVIGLYGKALQDQSRFKPLLVKHSIIASATPKVQNIDPMPVIKLLKEHLHY